MANTSNKKFGCEIFGKVDDVIDGGEVFGWTQTGNDEVLHALWEIWSKLEAYVSPFISDSDPNEGLEKNEKEYLSEYTSIDETAFKKICRATSTNSLFIVELTARYQMVRQNLVDLWHNDDDCCITIKKGKYKTACHCGLDITDRVWAVQQMFNQL